jgi:Holliday junction resolvasome RuvABC DNA-binding subunit
VLCGAHHRAAHRGHLCIDGKVSTGIRVHHADGTAYGFMPSPTLADASAKTFAALTNLGYPEKAARSALERALAETHASPAKETLLRSALAYASRS